MKFGIPIEFISFAECSLHCPSDPDNVLTIVVRYVRYPTYANKGPVEEPPTVLDRVCPLYLRGVALHVDRERLV